MKKATLKDPILERELSHTGYIRIPGFLPQAEISRLLSLYKHNHPSPDADSGMWNSLYNKSADGASGMSDEIQRILRPYIEPLFEEYYAPVATFMSKNNNEYGVCKLHRDFTITDESLYQYRNIWIPLVGTTVHNGALFALAGSNRVFDYELPMFCEWPYLDIEPQLMDMAQTIECNAGDMVIYLDKTLHGSHVNRSGDSRPVVHFGALHPEVEMMFYWLDRGTNTVRVYQVPFSFYLENNFSEPVGRYPLYKEYEYAPPPIAFDQARAALT